MNYVDRRDDSDTNVCPMCRNQPKATVVLKTITNKYIIIPNSICINCSRNENFILSDIEALHIVEHQDETVLSQLLERAQQRQIQMYMHDDEVKIEDLNALEARNNVINEEEEEEKIEEVSPESENQPLVDRTNIEPPVLDPNALIHLTCPHCSQIMTAQRTGGLIDISCIIIGLDAPVLDVQCPTCKSHVRMIAALAPLSMESTVATQMLAICNKNVMLQSHQRCANICIVVFMAIMYG